jgi:hypothetical protein
VVKRADDLQSLELALGLALLLHEPGYVHQLFRQCSPRDGELSEVKSREVNGSEEECICHVTEENMMGQS